MLATFDRGTDVQGSGPGRYLWLWDGVDGRCVATLCGSSDTIWSVAFSPDGRSVAAAVGGSVRVWDLSAGAAKETHVSPFPQGEARLSRVAYDPRGRLVAVEGRGRGLAIWDPYSGNDIRQVVPPPGSEYLFTFTDGVMASTGGKTFHLFDLATGSPLAEVPLDGDEMGYKSFAPTTGVLAALSGGNDRRDIRVWEAATGRTRTFLADGPYARPTISPDGRRLAVSVSFPAAERPPWLDRLRSWVGLAVRQDSRNQVRVYDVATGREQARFPGGCSGHFSPDGRSLAVVSSQIAVYDVPFHPPTAPVLGFGLAAAVIAYFLAGVRFLRPKTRSPVPAACEPQAP
jgi:WD40 repeat protein